MARLEYGERYLGSGVGESDVGFVTFNHRYTFPFSRKRENHYLAFQAFLDSLARLTDYQMWWNINLWGSHYALKEGYVGSVPSGRDF